MSEVSKNEGTIQSDSQLVEVARQGNDEAFSELIRRHWRKCVNLASLFVRNRTDAEDQAQDACVKAFGHLDQYHGEAEFSVWLSRIVVNQCLMSMRSRRRIRLLYLDEMLPESQSRPLQLSGQEPDPETELGRREMQTVLRSEIRRIPPLLRNVMLLADIEGLPLQDVACRLGITVTAAKSRLVRARTELRSRMGRHRAQVQRLAKPVAPSLVHRPMSAA
jgi:RNA polymerase sigma-70 factor (ECF subfamily)